MSWTAKEALTRNGASNMVIHKPTGTDVNRKRETIHLLASFLERTFTYLVQFEEFLGCVRQLTKGERWVDVHLLAKRAHHFLSVVPVREHAGGWDKSMHSVADGSHQNPVVRQDHNVLCCLLGITCYT
jgi:hypothetical protein